MSHEALLARLTDLGLSRNEALAYLTLLEHPDPGGLTGYEVAARSGIPRSAVYPSLRRLEAAGGAFQVGADPVRYLPTDPQTFVEQTRDRLLGRLDTLAEALAHLPRRSRPEPLWTLQRYEEVIDRAATLIRAAERSITLSLWPRELALLADALEAVAERPLHRLLHCPTALPCPPPRFSCWTDDLSGDPAKATWNHKILVVVDRSAVLVGGAEPDRDNQAVWSTNQSLVDLATNHVILDVTLLARARGLDCTDDVAPLMRPHL